MKNYLYTLITNRKINNCAMIIISMVFLLNTIFNGVLHLSKKRLTQFINNKINQTVSIRKLTYQFPNLIKLHDVVFINKSDHQSKEKNTIKRIQLDIALTELIINKTITAQKITFIEPSMPLASIYSLTSNNMLTLLEQFKDSKQNSFKSAIKNGVVFSQPNQNNPTYITDLSFEMNNNNIVINGSFNENTTKLTAIAHFDKNIFLLDDFILQGEKLLARFWGVGEDKKFILNGYSTINARNQGETNNSTDTSLSFLEKIKKQLHTDTTHTRIKTKKHTIEQIDCTLSFDYPAIKLHKLNMLINKKPLSISGQFILTPSTPFDLQAAFDERNTPSAAFTKLSLSGKTINHILFLDGSLNRTFNDNETELGNLNDLKINVDDLSLDLNNYPKIRITFASSESSWKLNNEQHTLNLNKSVAFLNLNDKQRQILKLKSNAYAGLLDGNFWIDTSTATPVIAAELSLKGADTEKLGDLLDILSNVKGKFDTTFVLSTYPKINIDGNLTITNADVTKEPFFDWVAESFDLPELKNIHFNKLESKFLVNSRKTGLFDITSDSNTMQIKGFYAVKNDGLVSSKLNLLFNRNILKNSKKCKILHKNFDTEQDFIDFDIQLSGDQNNINFHWLESDTKTAIQENMPNFIERIIERRVDKSLVSKNNAQLPIAPHYSQDSNE